MHSSSVAVPAAPMHSWTCWSKDGTGRSRSGTILAGYRMGAPLGRGGMSVVYLAKDPA